MQHVCQVCSVDIPTTLLEWTELSVKLDILGRQSNEPAAWTVTNEVAEVFLLATNGVAATAHDKGQVRKHDVDGDC